MSFSFVPAPSACHKIFPKHLRSHRRPPQPFVMSHLRTLRSPLLSTSSLRLRLLSINVTTGHRYIPTPTLAHSIPTSTNLQADSLSAFLSFTIARATHVTRTRIVTSKPKPTACAVDSTTAEDDGFSASGGSTTEPTSAHEPDPACSCACAFDPNRARRRERSVR